MRFVALFFVLLFMRATTAFALDFRQADQSDNLSQFVRANAPQFWWQMGAKEDLRGLHDYLDYQGVLAGDAHMVNFSIVPVFYNDGHRALAFVNVDFDDAGEGPFVLDFIRYEVAVQAGFPDIKRSDLEDAYLKGLAGQKDKVPSEIDDLLAQPLKDYDKQVDDYLDKKTRGDGFKFKPGEIEPYKAEIPRADIAKLFPGEKVLDLAIRPKERGGSADGLRIWVLVVNADGSRRIMELKQLERSALSYYQKQPALSTWLAEVREVFRPGMDGRTYDLVRVGEAGWFWLRQKQLSLIDVPYSSEKKKKLKFAQELAVFDANQLGLAHARQKDAAAYLRAIQRDRGAFHDRTGEVVKDYLQLAGEAFNRK